MASFTIDEMLQAVSGKLLHRGSEDFVSGISIDTRTITKGDAFIALRGENFDGHSFLKTACSNGASALVISDMAEVAALNPDISVILVKDTKEALKGLAHFHRMRFSIPVIGVTGSNGKTTTKDMLAAVLSRKYKVCVTQKNFNNEIGLSLTLLSLEPDTDVCVVEMGMRGLGQITELTDIAAPTMGIVTNVGTSHIGILGSRENIAKAKKELIDALPADGTAILNGDDPLVSKMDEGFSGRIVKYGLNQGEDVIGRGISYQAETTDFTCICGSESFSVCLKLLGVHNVYDALAAIAAAEVLDVTKEQVQSALQSFTPSDQRQSLINIGGFMILDDSYNANPLSMKMAFQSLKQLKGNHYYFVLGDMGELGDYERELHFQVGEAAAEAGADGLITVGPLSRHTADGAKSRGLPVIGECNTCEEAADLLKEILQPGDLILLKGSHYMHMELVIQYLRESIH